MTTAQEALALARRHNVTITVRCARLRLRAPTAPPLEVVEKLKEAKPAIIRLLAHPRPEPERAGWDATNWRAFFDERVAIREFGGHRSRAEAERLAWGETLAAWHNAHGHPPPRAWCAGCGKPLSSGAVMDIWDGARVHDVPGYGCLIAYGKRWRGAATAGLAALGLTPPESVSVVAQNPESVSVVAQNNGWGE